MHVDDISKLELTGVMQLTVSSCVYTQFWTARIPLFASKFIFKSVFTQCKTWLAITPTPTFILISLETLCAYMREDTVYMKYSDRQSGRFPKKPQGIWHHILVDLEHTFHGASTAWHAAGM